MRASRELRAAADPKHGVVLDPGKNICGDAIAAVPGCTTYRDVMEGFSSLNKVWKDASGETGKKALIS